MFDTSGIYQVVNRYDYADATKWLCAYRKIEGKWTAVLEGYSAENNLAQSEL